MNKREAYNLGKERGYNVASWIDLPELGDKVDKSIDWQGLGETVTRDNAGDYFFIIASESESTGRDYSPFEFTAHEFNEQANAESLWDEFDRGISKGILDNWKKRKEFYK